MKKFFIPGAALLVLLVFGLAAQAQVPDPRDSIILESKTVAAGLGAPNATDTAALVYLKVWITNKDSLSNITMPMEERSLCNNAYIIAGRPRNFNGFVSRLTPTLPTNLIAQFRYNSASPDSITVSAFFDALDIPNTAEPPNATRKAFWEFKFDSTSAIADTGTVQFDTIKILSVTVQFVDQNGVGPIRVNWVKSSVDVGSGCPTDVREIREGQRPQAYSLSQNYPNPFNANTQISFALPKSGKATLEIFNILGQKVNTLADGYMEAGYKIVNWDGRDNRGMEVPSGIYFYRLRSQEFLQTKKMLMIQ